MRDKVGLDKFLPFVMFACKGLPESIAQSYIRQTIIDFSKQSSVLRRHKTVMVTRGFDVFPIEPDDGENIVRINHVKVNGCCYEGVRGLCCFRACGRTFTVKDGFIHLSSSVQDDIAVEVCYTATPSFDACEVDAVFFDDWHHAIEDGVLSRLMLIPGYEFTQPQIAQHRALSYANHIKQARMSMLKAENTGVSRVRRGSFL